MDDPNLIVHGPAAAGNYERHLLDIYGVASMNLLPRCEQRVLERIVIGKFKGKIPDCLDTSEAAMSAYLYFITTVRTNTRAVDRLIRAEKYAIQQIRSSDLFEMKRLEQPVYTSVIQNMFRYSQSCDFIRAVCTKYGIDVPDPPGDAPAPVQQPVPPPPPPPVQQPIPPPPPPVQQPIPPPPVEPFEEEPPEHEIGGVEPPEHEIGGVEPDVDMGEAAANDECEPGEFWRDGGIVNFDVRQFEDDWNDVEPETELTSNQAVRAYALAEDLTPNDFYMAMMLSGNENVASVNALRKHVQTWLGMQPVAQRAPTQNANGTPNLEANGYIAQLIAWARANNRNGDAFRFCIVPLAFAREHHFWSNEFLNTAQATNVTRNCTEALSIQALVLRRPRKIRNTIFAQYLTQPSMLYTPGTLFDVLVPRYAITELGVFFRTGLYFDAARQRAMQVGFERAEYLNTLYMNVVHIWNALLFAQQHLANAPELLDALDETPLSQTLREDFLEGNLIAVQNRMTDVLPDDAHPGSAWLPAALEAFAADGFVAEDFDDADMQAEDFIDLFPDEPVNQLGARVRRRVVDALGFQPIKQTAQFRVGDEDNRFMDELNAWGQANPGLFTRLRAHVRGIEAEVVVVDAQRTAIIASNSRMRVDNYDRVHRRNRNLSKLKTYMAKPTRPEANTLMRWKLPLFEIDTVMRNVDNGNVVTNPARRVAKLNSGFRRKMERAALEEFVLEFYNAISVLTENDATQQLITSLQEAANPLCQMLGRTIAQITGG